MFFLAYWPLRLAWTDHLARGPDSATVERAVRLAPGDADVRLKLAAAQQSQGADPGAALASAISLDPGNAETWTRLGVEAEMRGDLRNAESHLLRAARASRQFAPRWELANYYVRRGDAVHFWSWARESLAIGYGDLSPVFRLCWNMSPDAADILARAIPPRRVVLNGYLRFLMQEGRMAAGAPVAAKLASLATSDDQATLITWCNAQLEASASASALDTWNTLCTRHLLSYAPLDRDRAPLTDGDFRDAPLGGGFAWRLARQPGITIGMNPAPRFLWIGFSGNQPETCAPLWQFVPVTPGATYILSYEYHTSELPAASGLRWSVLDARAGTELAPNSPWLSSPDWKREELHFTAPASGLARLILTYRRLPGSTRIEGSLELRHLALGRQP
jgi:hypothetical protein